MLVANPLGWFCRHAAQLNFPNILQGRDKILEKAGQISKIQKQMGMQVDSEYEETFKFGLMEVVFEWARGIVSVYNIYEF
jgi:superfamily II RNA helicase